MEAGGGPTTELAVVEHSTDLTNTRATTAESTATRARSPGRGGVDKNSVFLSFDDTDKEVNKRVHILKRKLQQSGKTVYVHDGHEKDPMELPESVKTTMKKCIVIVICVTRGYKVNQACQRVARYALTREKHSIVFFCLLQGDYSLSSYPDKVDGWLGHMIKDVVTYPCYSQLQLTQTVAFIEGVVIYRKRCIYVDEKEVDKWAARAQVVKRMMAKQRSNEELRKANIKAMLMSGASSTELMRSGVQTPTT